MAAKKKKPIIKSSALENTITSSLEALSEVSSNSAKAIAAVTKHSKTLTILCKRLLKTRAKLIKAKKRADISVKKEYSSENKKILHTIIKDIRLNKKEFDKATSQKSLVFVELKGLRDAAKRSNTFVKAIDAAIKVLNKPKKKIRKKKIVVVVENNL